MTRDELQAAADTAWMILGPDQFGVSVREDMGIIVLDVAGTEGGQMFLFSEGFHRHVVEQQRGNTRYNFSRMIIRCLRNALKDLRKAQIEMSLGT